jgi:hypothetical protein
LLASLVHRILWVAFAAAPLASAAAEPVTLSGVTFSDERGGFVIKSATGKGTYEEPFVISEEITDPEGAVLTIRGDMARVGNRIGTLHQLGFAITKIVTNNTGEAWSLFELELQETYGTPSDYYDGLSFGQAAQPAQAVFERPLQCQREHERADRRAAISATARSNRGERVTLNFVITDAHPGSRILPAATSPAA